MGIFEKLGRLLTRSPTEDPSRTSDSGSEEPDTTPTTDTGKVLRLLVQNDGRMKKSELIDEIGLEESRTIRVLSDMEDDDDVRLVPYDGGVLVCRPGYEPPDQRVI